MKENKALISFSTGILFVFTLLCIFVPIAKAADNGKIRITCVGDSITDGIGASNGQNTYPAQLQKILGDKYEVLNKGVSGTTVTNSDDRAYTKTSRYRESLTSQPDIVIILLGTNDITTKGINTDEGKKVFKDDYAKLVRDYENCGSRPKIMVAAPLSSVDGNNKHDGRNDMNEKIQIPLIREVSEEMRLTFLDTHTYTATWTRTDIGDGLHPSDSGYVKLARYFANAVLGYVGNFNCILEENVNYQIIAKSSNMAMTIKGYSDQNAAEVVQMRPMSYESQCFYLSITKDGYYKIINLHSKKSLNVFGKSTKEGANIIQFNSGDEDNEKWVLEATGDGFWRITPKMSLQMGLNVQGNSKEQEANIIQFPFDGNDNNKWRFHFVDNVKTNPY